MRSALALLLILTACRNAPDRPVEIATSLMRREQYDQALEVTEAAVSRAEKSRNLQLAWRLRLMKAEILLARREAGKALDVLAADPPTDAEYLSCRGRRFLLRGYAESLRGKPAESERMLQQAAEIARTLGSKLFAAEVELRQAVLLPADQFPTAESAYHHVIEAAVALHDPYLEAQASGNLGYDLMSTASRFGEAIVWFERTRKLFREIGAPRLVARTAGNIGWCYFRLGDYENARVQFEQARAQAAGAGNKFEEQVWTGNLASVDFANHEFERATEGYRRALEIARQIPTDTDASRWASRWLSNLATTNIELRKWDEAEIYNQQAIELRQHTAGELTAIYSVTNAARIAQARGNTAEAKRLFRQAVGMPSNSPTEVLEAHAGLASLYRAEGRSRAAQIEYQAALRAVQKSQSAQLTDEAKLIYLSSLIRFYRSYVNLLMESGEPLRALEVAESSRSRVLAGRTGRLDVLETQGALAYRKVAADAKAVVLEYWLGEERSYLWAISADRIRHYTLPKAQDLQGRVQRFNAVVQAQRDPLPVTASGAQSLAESLLQPARDDLQASRRVLIVSDGELNGLNFEMLPSPADPSKPWIEDVTISVAPSLDYLIASGREPRPARPNPRAVLLVGDPHLADAALPKLEFAGQEIASIANASPQSRPVVLRGETATPASYRAAGPGQFDLIHFAAHASANRESPLDSAVILSGPPKSCKLFARDVMAVPLSAQLVTISACRSAGAKTYAGEGLVGFAWAFLRAGARNVIAGLWDVNDHSTARLMTSLYAGIDNSASTSDALREAKLSLIRAGGSYAKPYYWAPFQLYTRDIRQ